MTKQAAIRFEKKHEMEERGEQGKCVDIAVAVVVVVCYPCCDRARELGSGRLKDSEIWHLHCVKSSNNNSHNNNQRQEQDKKCE